MSTYLSNNRTRDALLAQQFQSNPRSVVINHPYPRVVYQNGYQQVYYNGIPTNQQPVVYIVPSSTLCILLVTT